MGLIYDDTAPVKCKNYGVRGGGG